MHTYKLKYLLILLLAPVNSVNAVDLSHVASLTVEDTVGNVKTQLERTTSSNCDKKLKSIINAAKARAGIARIVSSKCGDISPLIGYFERKSMDVPYVIVGDNSVLILRGANKRDCNNLALLMKQNDSKSTCIFPATVYK